MKWPKKLQSSYKVKIAYDKHERAKITVPKKLIDLFNRPETVTFRLENDNIVVDFVRDSQSAYETQ